MTNVLVIGANGQIARVAVRVLLRNPGVRLTLYLRNARRLDQLSADQRVRIVEGDARDQSALEKAMAGQDIIYANLSGDLASQARAIIAAMSRANVRRLIFVSSMGIYGEVPGESHGSVLDPYRESVFLVEASDLDYTIIRPAWLDDRDIVSYGTTRKGEAFRNPEKSVSRRSVADLIERLILDAKLGLRESLGVHGT